MDPLLEAVIRKALADAWANGKDHLTQTEEAVRAVLETRADMTPPDARAAVSFVKRSG
jgi:hypothetical protein